MEDFTLKDIIECAFTILEEENAIKYTKKYTREYLIEGFSQEEILPHWKWFNFSSKSGLSKQLNNMVKDNINKPNSRSWFDHLQYITGFKYCKSCNSFKEFNTFYKYYHNDSKKYRFTNVCKNCDNTNNRKYRINNKEKIKTKNKIWKLNKLKEDPLYFKKYNSLNKKRFKERTPKWADLYLIQEFYSNCPLGYHVDHIIPLNGELVSGLHTIENLQYLTAEDNLKKGNKYNIDQEKNEFIY